MTFKDFEEMLREEAERQKNNPMKIQVGPMGWAAQKELDRCLEQWAIEHNVKISEKMRCKK